MAGQIHRRPPNDLDKSITEWCRQDKDEESRGVIQKLVRENNMEELDARLGSRKSALQARRLNS